MEPKLLTRDQFREGVFARDGHRCVFCNEPAQDAHHILERRLWTDGGYYLENGASVCGAHHLACEQTTISVEDVRAAAGITRKHVPEHLYADHVYDKWGNPVLEDGRRGKGELFYDESVQKVLAQGGVLDRFTEYVKYSRTNHLPWSPGLTDDDRVMHDLTPFIGQDVVASRKMDGENTNMYPDHIHARSIDSRGGADRAWVKQFWSTFAHDIPPGWRICGENLWAEHSIHYNDLKSYFLGFSMWDERNNCLSWDDTMLYFQVLGIEPVPVLYRGIFSEKVLHDIEKNSNWNTDEGYVVRLASGFPYSEFKRSIAKYVRAGHVQTQRHWRAGRAFNPNGLQRDDGSSKD